MEIRAVEGCAVRSNTALGPTVRASSVAASASDHNQFHRNVIAGGVGVGADLVGARDQRLCDLPIGHGRQVDLQLHREAVSPRLGALADGPDPDACRDLRIVCRKMLPPGAPISAL